VHCSKVPSLIDSDTPTEVRSPSTRTISQTLTPQLLASHGLLESSLLVRCILYTLDFLSILDVSPGKTVTPNFTVANTETNTTNPYDPKRTPSGSSCRSTAAVADLQVPLSVGTQIAGSIIRPASLVGVYAMKPTHSTVCNDGQMTSR
jgi:hypothetical protein